MSQRGPEGGYQLAVPPETLSVAEVIRVVDGPRPRSPACGPRWSAIRRAPRRFPGVWLEARTALRAVLEQITFADLVERSKRGTRSRRGRPVSHKPAYLIAGGDWPKVEAAAARLRSQFPDEAVEQITVRRRSATRSSPPATRWACWAASGWCWCAGGGADRGADAARSPPTSRIRRPTPAWRCSAATASRRTARWPPPCPRSATSASSTPPDEKEAASAGWSSGSASLGISLLARRRPPAGRARRRGDRRPRPGGREGRCLLRREEPDVETVDLLVVGEMDIKPWDVTDAWGRRDAGRVIELATAGIERPDDVHRTLAPDRQPRAPRQAGPAADGARRATRPRSPSSWG